MLDNKIGLTTIILVATISIAFISVLSPVDGESYDAGGVTYSYTSDSNEAIVVSYDGSVSDVCILSVFTAGDVEYNVVEIADSAFEGSISLKSVSIPVSVKTIGNAAFKDCVSLENAVIIVSDDDAYASRIIGKSAFENCTSLKSVSSHPSLTPGIASFKNCGLESVTVYLRSFSKSGYISSSELFMNCTQLSSVDIVKGDANFYGFSGDSIFEGCTSLKSIPIPDVEKLRFRGMMGSRVFMNSGIENVVIESASASTSGIIVGANSFDGCESLKTFIINTKVDFSGAGLTGHPTTFGGCVIEKMELAEWQSTDFRAFDGCTIDFLKLGNVQYLNAVPEDCLDRIIIKHIDLGGALSTSLSGDIKDDEKMSTVATIPGLESITMTGENTKYGMVGSGVYRLDYYNAETPTDPVALIISSPDAVAIDIPSTVTSVGADAFTNCRNLTRVSFPEGLTTFAYAGNDVSFVDADGMPVGTDVENFAGCTYVGSDGVLVLQIIEVGTTFTADGIEYKLTSLNPAQCSVTGYEPGLKDLVVPKTVEYAGKDYRVLTIGNRAFYQCKTLETADLGSVTSIGASAFNYCSYLKSVDFGDSLKTIGSYAFNKCFYLKNADLTDSASSLKTIGAYAFNKCSKISVLAVSGNVQKIYSTAFTVPFTDAEGNALAVSADDLKGHVYKNVKGTFVQQEAVSEGTEFDDGVLIYSVKSYLPCTAEVIGYTGTLKYLAIPESVQFKDLDYKVTEIAPKAFFKCKTIVTADLGNVKKVGSEAFSVCSNLKSVTMTSVTDIEAKAFAYCPKLVTVEFGDQLSIIRASAFFKCYKLAELDLPDSLKTIRNSAFSECKLEKVSFGTGLKTVTNSAFAGTVFMDGETVLKSDAASLKNSEFSGSGGILYLI